MFFQTILPDFIRFCLSKSKPGEKVFFHNFNRNSISEAACATNRTEGLVYGASLSHEPQNKPDLEATRSSRILRAFT